MQIVLYPSPIFRRQNDREALLFYRRHVADVVSGPSGVELGCRRRPALIQHKAGNSLGVAAGI